MSVNPRWVPSRTISVTVSVYNSGRARMVRVTGPSGEAGMAPMNPRDWQQMIGWASDVILGELGVALGQLDEEARKLEAP